MISASPGERPRLRVDFEASEAAVGQSAWASLACGVEVLLRPMSGLVSASIEAQIARELYAFHQGADVLERFGFSAEDAGFLADEQVALGFAGILHAVIRGVNLIEDWNLDDGEGAPVPVELRTVRALFHAGPVPGTGPVIMAAFNRLVDAPAQMLSAEKNAYAPSPNGDSEGARNTAPDVGSTAPPAPTEAAATAPSAPKPKTPRKRRTASPR